MSNPKNEPTSKVKLLILKMLESGRWVSSSVLLEKTGQKYFDRRIRELRDELGYDIETGFQNGEPAYRLRSTKRLALKPRTYLGASERNNLLKSWSGECALCGTKIDHDSKPVFDHRVPLIRGGGGFADNFQIVCVECNNQKRSQCRGCDYDCKKCYLAFPEKYPKGILLRIPSHDMKAKIDKIAAKKNLNSEEWLLQQIEALLKKVG